MIATALDRLEAPPSSRLLGWHLLDARPDEGWIRIGFDGKREFCNPAGFIQGGILSAMLDDTMGPAVFVMTEGRLYTATISMTVNFLAPAKVGAIIGEAKVTQLGKTVAFVEGRLMAADGTRAGGVDAPARDWSRPQRRSGSCGRATTSSLRAMTTPRWSVFPAPASSRSAAWR